MAILDFANTLNPLGPPDNLRQAVSRGVEGLSRAADAEAVELCLAIAGNLRVQKKNIVLGNGSTSLIYAAARAFRKKRAVIALPARDDFAAAAEAAGLPAVGVPPLDRQGFDTDLQRLGEDLKGDEIVFIGQPSAITGRSSGNEELLTLLDAHPDTFFVIDESLGDFISPFAARAARTANLLVVRSFSSLFAAPGLRLGYGCATPETIGALRSMLPPRPLGTLALTAGRALLDEREYIERTYQEVPALRRRLLEQLRAVPGLAPLASDSFFILVRITDHKWSSDALAEKILAENIRVKSCDGIAGLPAGGRDCLRIAVRTEPESENLVDGLRGLLTGQKKTRPVRKAFSLMVQGTCSNAGKSVLTAALCRILLQDGFRIAPFKAQNISLNSFVTRDGLEMGRAQVVQAQASLLDPDVRMNPILVKLSSDEAGSQVIMNGRPVDSRTASHPSFREKAWQAAQMAYDELAAEFDGIILEGAGSPGEVNLKKNDFVNMRMARHAEAPVLLAGDIDRGGVFASFIGHMEVLYEWERALVAGFVVNRFRGRQDLLTDALHYTERHTGRPVLGVVPYLHDLGLPEEDSVSFKDGLYERSAPAGEHIEIGLIDLPHISNFTDFEPFLGEPDVHLRVIKNASELDTAGRRLSAVILPGSKNVMNDMAYLVQTGLAERLQRLAATGKVEMIGICGGYQMLGSVIADPHGLESAGHEMEGLGLLDMITVLEKDKTLRHRVAVHTPSGLEVRGYEIHHGRTETRSRQLLLHTEEDRICAATEDGMIWGSYLHGIFDADGFRRWFIDRLRERQNLQAAGKIQYAYDLEPALNRLADVVRQALDMERIYRLLKI